MQLETGNNINNYQLSIRLILREPGDTVPVYTCPNFFTGRYRFAFCRRLYCKRITPGLIAER